MKSQLLLWILEDDPGIQFMYEETLGIRYDLQFFSAVSSFAGALQTKPQREPDLIVADLRLPDQSFMSFLSSDRSRSSLRCPFIVVSSLDDMDALRYCFTHGAADYLVKPFRKSELVVKIERILNSAKIQNPMKTAISPWSLDPITLSVCRAGKAIGHLTSKEFQILSILHQAPDQTISRDQLCAAIWSEVQVTAKTFDVHLGNLRKKLSPLGMEIVLCAPGIYAIQLRPMDETAGPLRL
jgi:DNA-binding response OmpR family regulator